MTKVSKGIAKSILMIMLLIFSVWACSNENVLSSVQQAISNGGTDIYDFDDGRSGDGIAAVLLKFDGADYGAELYEVTAVCLSDKKVGTYQNYTEGWLTVFELPVGKYKFTVVGKDKAKVNTYCVGTVTLTLDDEVDMTAFVSLVYADNSTQIEYSSSSSDGFLFEFVDTLCVGETKNVQLTTADNWFGFISSSEQTLYLKWMTNVSIQNVIVYKDGRSENNIVCGKISDENFNATQYTIEAESGEHYYYIRVIATQATNECQLSLTDSAAQVPTSTTTTIPPVVTTTSTSTTSSTSTSTSIAPTPTVKTEKPVISYSATNSKATIVCPQSNASIYYTTNNGNPSVRYTGAITASVGTTIKAMAKAPGYLDSDIVSYTISPTVTINVDFEEDFSGIRVLVAKSLNFPKIYYWDASDANAYPKPSWPGVDMLSYDDKDYCYEFKGCTSVKLLITNASNAKLCGTDMEITSAGVYRVTSAGCKLEETVSTTTVSTTPTTSTSIYHGVDVTDKIIIHYPTTDTFKNVYVWTENPRSELFGSWPGKAMSDGNNDGWYDVEITSTSCFLIFNNPGQTDNLTRETGEWWYKYGSWSNTNPDAPPEPTKPVVTISPSSGTKIALNGSVSVAFTSGNDTITSAKVTINGTEYNMGKTGSFKKTVSELGITAVGKTISVSAVVTNGIGTTTATATFTTKEKASLVSDPNELRIYQVMVSSFQDGDPSIGYTNAHGPSNATKGGDLQGIINALDYIQKLGCNALWMTPIFQSYTGDERIKSTGYFANDYFNIDDHFGTNEKFAELVDACHSKGIAVILDGVFGHNGGTVTPSPNRSGIRNPGITPDTNNPVNYATNENSLKYYSDVARYWITEYKIDGWRFDQCYQLAHGEYNTGKNCNTGGHNYWYEIRNVIEEAAASNGTKGNDWGTLGYMVGEDWDGNAETIQKSVVDSWSSAGYGLNSCFDFPAYYQVVQGFAQEWDGKTTGNISTGLKYLYKTYTEKGYICKDSDGSYDIYYPNFMLSNHDLYRIGDLINRKWGCGYESNEYVGRNKVLLAAQCAYSGPITIYYGDEIGARSADNSNGSGWYSDNVARSSGKISGFSNSEQAVHDWTQKCLKARSEHEALWSGTNTELRAESDFYVAKKVGGGETIYIAFNYSTSQKTFSGSGTDLISGANYSGTVTVPALSAVYVLAK